MKNKIGNSLLFIAIILISIEMLYFTYINEDTTMLKKKPILIYNPNLDVKNDSIKYRKVYRRVGCRNSGFKTE